MSQNSDVAANMQELTPFPFTFSAQFLLSFFSFEQEVSRGWTASELILRVPIDNWIAYTEVSVPSKKKEYLSPTCTPLSRRRFG